MKKRKLSRWTKEAIETIGTIAITIAMGYAMLIIFGLFFCWQIKYYVLIYKSSK